MDYNSPYRDTPEFYDDLGDPSCNHAGLMTYSNPHDPRTASVTAGTDIATTITGFASGGLGIS